MKKKLLILDDEQSILDSLSRVLRDLGYEILTSAEPAAALKIIQEELPHVVITDLKMPELDGLEILQRIKDFRPEIQVILITGHGSIDDAVLAMKRGAYDFIPKPFKRQEIAAVVHRAFDKAALLLENLELREKLKKNAQNFETGKSRKFRELLARAAQAAASDSTVLILGEAGSGKEVLANYIVQNSKRALQPFVKVNCAAVPEGSLEMELFGYRKGAFPGAQHDKQGKLLDANGGSLLIDEIGEAPLQVQSRILHFLQTGEIVPMGGEPVKVDVRVIASSSVPLRKFVDAGTFREDLFYRLNVIPLGVSPLRERSEDLHDLILHFIAKYCRKNNRQNLSVSAEALRIMERYGWPGNVRELENAIERAVILCLGHQITVEDLPPELSGVQHNNPIASIKPGMTLSEIELAVLRGTLDANQGDKAKTAQDLGVSLRTIYRKLDALGGNSVSGKY
jgi:two-component system, NtrC family, response regulator HydG